VARFNRAMAETSAESFVRDLLVQTLAVRHVVVGENFRFGKGRSGDVALLRRLSSELGFGLTAVAAVVDSNGAPYASTRLRQALARGDMRAAAAVLGRPYDITGHVGHGTKTGRKLGVPTANLGLQHLFRPYYGVYVARLRVGDDGVWQDAVCSVGVRPTFGGEQPLLEAHVLDARQDLYGKRVTVQLLQLLRGEERFATPEALQAQMVRDIAEAREILDHEELL
jgi:riboflavin kinase / FMN adenylyltransferase